MGGGYDTFGSFERTDQQDWQPQRPGSGGALFLETMKGYEAITTGVDLTLGGSLIRTAWLGIRSVVGEGAASEALVPFRMAHRTICIIMGSVGMQIVF